MIGNLKMGLVALCIYLHLSISVMCMGHIWWMVSSWMDCMCGLADICVGWHVLLSLPSAVYVGVLSDCF